MDVLSGIHVTLANTCFWMLAGRQYLILVSKQINTVTPPTLPPLCLSLLPLWLDTDLLFLQIKNHKLLCCLTSFTCDCSRISLHLELIVTMSLPTGLLYSLAMSPTGPPSTGLHRYAKVPTTHISLLSIASSAWTK